MKLKNKNQNVKYEIFGILASGFFFWVSIFFWFVGFKSFVLHPCGTSSANIYIYILYTYIDTHIYIYKVKSLEF